VPCTGDAVESQVSSSVSDFVDLLKVTRPPLIEVALMSYV
jgi:hypothetical protein